MSHPSQLTTQIRRTLAYFLELYERQDLHLLPIQLSRLLKM